MEVGVDYCGVGGKLQCLKTTKRKTFINYKENIFLIKNLQYFMHFWPIWLR